MNPSLIDDLSSGIPSLELFILRCKELNKKREVEDNERNVIEAAMAIFASVARKDETKFVCASMPTRLETLEQQTSEHVRRINQMSIELRAAVDEQNKLLKQVKDAKDAVVEEYRDALSQFRDIMNNTDVENAGSMGQFHTILEGVIREVINEDNGSGDNKNDENTDETTDETTDDVAIPIETENNEGISEFESLFTDQHVMEMFDRAFNTEDIMQQGPIQGFSAEYIEPPPMDDLQIQLETEMANAPPIQPPTISVVVNYDVVPTNTEEEEKEEETPFIPPPPPSSPPGFAVSMTPPSIEPRRRNRRRSERTRRANTLNLS